MADWFTVEAIDKNTFVISEYAHPEESHSYLLCGDRSALLIDTGLGVDNIQTVVADLTDLPVSVATTHVHWDHIGGHRFFKQFAVHQAEVSWISETFPLTLDNVKQQLFRSSCVFPSEFDIGRYRIFRGIPSAVLHDGDCLDLGNRQVTVIHTPGHSPGHCCFYEKDRQYLFSGDLIYRGCLGAFYPSTDPHLFFDSVTRILALPTSRILPAHHSLDIPVSLVWDIHQGFSQLQEKGLLRQGNGIFDFEKFQIHI